MIDNVGILAIGTAVSIATEIIKTALKEEDPEAAKRAGPVIAILVSLFFTFAYVFSQPLPPQRTDIWPLLMGWLTVTATAMGVYQGTKITASAAKRAIRAAKKESGE